MDHDTIPTRVIMIGIGGATSSGKTTLAKHLRNCLPGSFIVHQDDFVPPAEKLPVDPEFGFANWDDAPGAIEWDRMASFISDLKKSGELPSGHRSVDEFNETSPVNVEESVIAAWRARSEQMAKEHLDKYGERLRIVSNLDVKVFIRVSEGVARERRESRSYYTPGGYYYFGVIGDCSSRVYSEGEVWKDPPQYWEKIVWPAYIRAHEHLFEEGDVESGKVKEGYILLEGDMEDMVRAVMVALKI
ncbi:hypothetical protein CC1G_12108 [Coprinopsis cinerea okayama7|uniref:P-loop containing nucleoside triphosphate hydrolase protein n=1 Tax=Coprinopsis cinerea (strain Okayama-7 / 130 / ATCC MYA-4618 / FGSC 9003) TaxID=240176 RepID=A8PHA9_COPC7|nr:hypothetical protein CC1G_12108 [Coprinopsis cinerea okayama7\|eukprot:XP_001841373.2 hypothetical protein CC1G_12108 [Coprinopsis cinerea okayama7\